MYNPHTLLAFCYSVYDTIDCSESGTSDVYIVTAVSKLMARSVTEAVTSGSKALALMAATGPPSLPAVDSLCEYIIIIIAK